MAVLITNILASKCYLHIVFLIPQFELIFSICFIFTRVTHAGVFGFLNYFKKRKAVVLYLSPSILFLAPQRSAF